MGVLPYIAVILCVISWSSFHAVSRYAITQYTEFIIPFFRSVFSIPIVALIMLCTDRKLFYINTADLPYCMLLGAVGAGYNQVLFIYGLSLTSASDGGISQPLITVITLILSVMCKLEALTWSKLIGTAISLSGCMVIVGSEYTSNTDEQTTVSTQNRVLGWIIFVLQCFVYASYLILNKRIAHRIHWLTLSFYTLLCGLICTASVGLPFAIVDVNWSHVNMYGWLCLVYIAVFASVFSQLLWNYAQKTLAPSITASAILLAPLASSALGYMFLGERLTVYDLIGAVLIIGGVALVIYGRSQEVNLTTPAFTKLPTEDTTDIEQSVRKPRSASIQLSHLADDYTA